MMSALPAPAPPADGGDTHRLISLPIRNQHLAMEAEIRRLGRAFAGPSVTVGAAGGVSQTLTNIETMARELRLAWEAR